MNRLPQAGIRISPRCDGTSVAVIEPTEHPISDVVVLMGFRAWLDPFEIQRFRLLSERLSARLVVPETPGISTHRSRLKVEEAGGLLRGDLGPVATRMWRATRDRVPDLGHTRPLQVVGYSLGASMAAAMLAATNTCEMPALTSLNLIEPVATHRWPILRLLRRVSEEDRRTAAYLARNRRWAGVVLPSENILEGPRPVAHLPSLVAQGAAMRAGGLITALQSAVAEHHVPTLMVRGEASLLSTTAGCQRVVAALQAMDAPVIDLPVPGGHALWHSLDDVVALAERVRAEWARLP